MRGARIVVAFDRPSMYLLVDKARNICFTASNNRVKIVACMVSVVNAAYLHRSFLCRHIILIAKWKAPADQFYRLNVISRQIRGLFCPFLFKRVNSET